MGQLPSEDWTITLAASPHRLKIRIRIILYKEIRIMHTVTIFSTLLSLLAGVVLTLLISRSYLR